MDISEKSELALRAAARRSYERGRLKGGLLRGAGALALAFPGFLVCGKTPAAAACLLGLAVAVVLGRIRGEAYEEGIRAGFLAGILPCMLPVMLRLYDRDLCDLLFARGPWLCILGGIAAGVILGLRSRASAGVPFWGSALITLSLAATLGCLPAGVMGFAGLLAGVVAGGVPVLAARRAAT